MLKSVKDRLYKVSSKGWGGSAIDGGSISSSLTREDTGLSAEGSQYTSTFKRDPSTLPGKYEAPPVAARSYKLEGIRVSDLSASQRRAVCESVRKMLEARRPKHAAVPMLGTVKNGSVLGASAAAVGNARQGQARDQDPDCERLLATLDVRQGCVLLQLGCFEVVDDLRVEQRSLELTFDKALDLLLPAVRAAVQLPAKAPRDAVIGAAIEYPTPTIPALVLPSDTGSSTECLSVSVLVQLIEPCTHPSAILYPSLYFGADESAADLASEPVWRPLPESGQDSPRLWRVELKIRLPCTEAPPIARISLHLNQHDRGRKISGYSHCLSSLAISAGCAADLALLTPSAAAGFCFDLLSLLQIAESAGQTGSATALATIFGAALRLLAFARGNAMSDIASSVCRMAALHSPAPSFLPHTLPPSAPLFPVAQHFHVAVK